MYIYCSDRYQQHTDELPEYSRVHEQWLPAWGSWTEGQIAGQFKMDHGYNKARVGDIFRVVGKTIDISGERVFVLLDVFQRSLREYQKFLDDPKEYGATHLEPEIRRDRIERWIAQRKHEENAARNRPRDPVPEGLIKWLAPLGGATLDRDYAVYESDEWVGRSRLQEYREEYASIHGLVQRLIESELAGEPVPGEILFPPLRRFQNDQGLGIVFNLFRATRPGRQEAHVSFFLLFQYLRPPTREEIQSVYQRQHPEAMTLRETGNERGLSPLIELERLSQSSGRCYPGYVALDTQMWRSVQQDRESNLALSAEEEATLEDVSAHGEMPVFINGRAGSGKSTMLNYLYAEYVHQTLQLPEVLKTAKPLYFSYSDRLVTNARDTVVNILRSNHNYQQKRAHSGPGGSSGLSPETIRDIQSRFHAFRKYLLDLLPEGVKDRFHPDLYLSFDRFRRLYRNEAAVRESVVAESNKRKVRWSVCRLPEASRITPELAWHVIRTYIKGAAASGYMDPEQYKCLPQKDKTVSVETYSRVYDNVWRKWYSSFTVFTEDEVGLWDDQDLVRAVLGYNLAQATALCVFCDEAQDFTRIELDLIMRLSRFSQFDLGDDRVMLLPYAFAGDPLQTLNPTGFRWETTQRLFYEVVVKSLRANPDKLGIHHKELLRNYRSNRPVVAICNLILLWRRILFGLDEVKPQQGWPTSQVNAPEYFILDDALDIPSVIECLRDVTVIVPCEEGQEAEHLRQDPVLRRLLLPNGSAPANVFSASAAKGLEFGKVVVYGFGQAASAAVEDLLASKSRGMGVDDSMELHYFFNKLYVAVSRARRELYIVDTPEGFEKLWQWAAEPARAELFLSQPGAGPEWNEALRNPGRADENSQIRLLMRGSDPRVVVIDDKEKEAVATECFEQGLAAKDPQLLERACSYYRALQPLKALECEALALRYREQYTQAGDIYLKLRKFDEAKQCYWLGCEWQRLLEWNRAARPAHPCREVELARLLTASPTIAPDRFLEDLSDFIRNAIGTDPTLNSFQRQWQSAVGEFVRYLEPYLHRAANADRETLMSWAALLCELDERGFRGVLAVAATAYFKAQEYRRASRCWERAGQDNHRDYFISMGYSEGQPVGLVWWRKAGESELILEQWRRKNRPASDEWWTVVAPLLAEGRKTDKLQELFTASLSEGGRGPRPRSVPATLARLGYRGILRQGGKIFRSLVAAESVGLLGLCSARRRKQGGPRQGPICRSAGREPPQHRTQLFDSRPFPDRRSTES